MPRRPAPTPLRWMWPLIVVALACGSPVASGGQAPGAAAPSVAAAPAPAPAAPKREPANVMSYEKADWLEREGGRRWRSLKW